MVGVSKKLYNGVVKYLSGAATQLRESAKTEADARVLNILDAVVEMLNEPAKDDFERMLILAIISDTLNEASGTLLVLQKYGFVEDAVPEMFMYGTVIGVCNLTLLQAGVTTEKVKAYVEEQQDAVVLEDHTLIGESA